MLGLPTPQQGTVLLLVALLAPLVGSVAPLSPATATIDAELLATIQQDPEALVEAFVILDRLATFRDAAAAEALGVHVGRVFNEFGVLYVVGPGAAILRLTSLPDAIFLSGNRELEYFSGTGTVSTRAREVWDLKTTSTNPVTVGGGLLDGRGVSVAVVDSGIDATHPDLEPAVVRNVKFACYTPGLVSTVSDTCYGNYVVHGNTGCSDTPPTWLASDNTDTSSGHGTHVAGIVAGRGTASDGRFMGAAPGATLYGLGTGEGLSILFALEAFNWVNCNAATHGIRVVTNSWGLPGAYAATDPINVAVNVMVSNGLVVIFSAGNDGPGTGTVNTYARNPTPGVVSVANFDDLDRADRSPGALDSTTSRCSLSPAAASDCPDVAAPGTFITSTVAKNTVVIPATETNYIPYYGQATGTSMAAPHVAGIVALMLQANPALTPAQVECILERTAVQFAPFAYTIADPSCGGGAFLNNGAGHGLVDAVAALEDPLVIGTSGLGSPLPQVSQNPHVYQAGAVDPLVVGGVSPTLPLQWTALAGVPVTLSERFMESSVLPLIGQPCRFQVFVAVSGAATYRLPGALVASLPCTIGAEPSMDVSYTFPASGGAATYVVEPQVDFGVGMTAVDSFQVRVVG